MSSASNTSSKGAAIVDDDDEWESMPVENARSVSASIPVSAYSNPHDLPYGDEEEDDSDPDDPRRFRSLPFKANRMDRTASGTVHKRTKNRSQYLSDNTASASTSTGLRSHKATTNATGKHLDIDDARGYDWRSKPANHDNADDEDDSDQEKGYTQLRLDEDEEAEELHAKTEYLFADGSRHDPYGDNPAATPLNQMKTTKQLLSEGRKIAYVGLCSLIASEMVRQIRCVPGKSLDGAKQSVDEWKVKVMARLYQHMDIESPEQRMIESLGEHGVLATDLAPSLITTQTIDNPDFDPEALREREEEEAELEKEREAEAARQAEAKSSETAGSAEGSTAEKAGTKDDDASSPTTPTQSGAQPTEKEGEDADGDLDGGDRKPIKLPADEVKNAAPAAPKNVSEGDNDQGDIGIPQDVPATSGKTQPISASSNASTPVIADPNTASQLANAVDAVGATPLLLEAEVGPGSVTTTLGLTKEPQAVQPPPGALDGVTTSISSADATITLDLRWTVLCDLFLVLTADSVYDARSRVLLERVASYLGLTWMDVTQFEKRITDALEIEEGVESLSDESAVKQRMLMARKKRMVMMGLATVGGGLVIGLSAGLLAPVIGAGMGAALGAVGISGTSGFLGGVGGAALITSTGTLGGMSMAGRGMSRRTRSVKTFEFRPIHNNKRVNAIVAVPGFMSGAQDDVRLPFSVIDSVMGDLFSVLWEPDMMQEMGNSLGLLWNETIVQGVQQALALTVAGAGAMFTALAWPLWLTKLGYLIDNPWSNALDRAQAAGLILADTLAKRQLGVRPITLVGFSLGARVIFYALLELSRIKAYGIVQNVYIMGAPITAKDETWKEVRSVVSGRFVSAFSRSDWILGYLHRAASGGLRSIAGLHPIERVQDIENVDVTHVVPGHLAYRALMPLVLSELGFRTTADYFDEPEDLNAIPERQVVLEEKPSEKELKPVATKTGGFGKIFRRKAKNDTSSPSSMPSTPTAGTPRVSSAPFGRAEYDEYEDDDLPPRVEQDTEAGAVTSSTEATQVSEAKKAQDEIVKQSAARVEAVRASHERAGGAATPEVDRPSATSAHFDTEAILRELRESGIEVKELESSLPPLPLATNADKAVEPSKMSSESSTSQKSGQATSAMSANANERGGFGAPSFPTQDIPLPPEMQNGGVSLTFASYDDEEDEVHPRSHQAGDSSGHAAEGSGDSDLQKYGLSSSAAKDLAERFKGGGMGSPGVADSPVVEAPWSAQDEGWGLARPDSSYDVSMGTKSALHSLPTSSGFGYGETRSPNASMDQSFEGLTPLSTAVGRGFDFSSATGTGSLSSAGVKTPTPTSERTPRRLGTGNLSSEPDPWAENPW